MASDDHDQGLSSDELLRRAREQLSASTGDKKGPGAEAPRSSIPPPPAPFASSADLAASARELIDRPLFEPNEPNEPMGQPEPGVGTPPPPSGPPQGSVPPGSPRRTAIPTPPPPFSASPPPPPQTPAPPKQPPPPSTTSSLPRRPAILDRVSPPPPQSPSPVESVAPRSVLWWLVALAVAIGAFALIGRTGGSDNAEQVLVEVADCFESLEGIDSAGVTLQDCASPHDVQVFAVIENGPSETDCDQVLIDVLGSDYMRANAESVVIPDDAVTGLLSQPERGVMTFLCTIESLSGQLVGSLLPE